MYVYENHQGVERRSASQVALRREKLIRMMTWARVVYGRTMVIILNSPHSTGIRGKSFFVSGA